MSENSQEEKAAEVFEGLPAGMDLSATDLEKYGQWLKQDNTIVLTMTPDGCLTYMNQYGLGFFGFDWPGLAGKHVVGTIVPETESGGRDLTEMIHDLGQQPDFYVTNINENICADGKRVWVAWRNTPIQCLDGTTRTILSIGQNVTGFTETQDDKIFSQYALDHVDEAFLWMDGAGQLIYANASASRLLQYSRQKLLSMSIFEIDVMLSRLDWDRRHALVQKAFESMYRRQDGVDIPVAINASQLSYRGHNYICCSVRDITRHRLAEKKIQCERHKLQDIITHNPLAISVFDLDGQVLSTNEKGRKLFGDAPLKEFRLSRVPEFARSFLQAKEGQISRVPEHWLNPHDVHPLARNRHICLRTVLFPIRGPEGIENVVAMHEDVSQRRWLENELLAISEREQEKIGQELHDSLGQNLTGLALLGKALQERLITRAPEEAEAAGQLVALANDVLSDCREIARGFSLVTLKSLQDGLFELAENAESRLGLACHCQIDELPKGLDPSVKMHLYRITQEALNNAARHSGATDVEIHLDELDAARREYALSILDNGCGITPEDRQGDGMGLHLMRHRAEMIGAKLTICRGPEAGTLVRCCFEDRPIPDIPLADPAL
jgi:PAS domain S-box-containing protein